MSSVKSLYLVMYNLFQTFGWTFLVYKSTEHFHLRTDNGSLELWHSVEHILKIFQTVALLEIVHAVFSIVKSNVPITTFQVLARLLNLWGILNLSPPTQKSIGLPLIIIAWGITEIVRYGHYTTSLLRLPSVLQWFRYSMFIVLYPLGLIGELIDIYYTLQYVKGRNVWGHILPSWLDYGVTYFHVIIALTCILVPLTPFLYLHMLSQRRKILGEKKQTKIKSKSK